MECSGEESEGGQKKQKAPEKTKTKAEGEKSEEAGEIRIPAVAQLSVH